MSSSKKRKSDGMKIGASDRDDASLGGPGRGKRRSKFLASTNEEFLRTMKIREKTELMAVNKQFTSYLKEAPDGRPSLSAVNERIRAEAVIKGRYDFQNHCAVVGMGNNENCQLGFGEDDEKDVHPPTMLKIRDVDRISAGGMHSVAICAGTPFSFGPGDDGALGRTADHYLVASNPSPVIGFVTNDGIKEDGQIIAVAAGDSHTIFLSAAGNVYQCGQYKDMDSGKFSDVGPNGSPKGSNAKPVHVKMPGKVSSIHTQAAFNAVVMQDGQTVLTWGFGTVGELARSAQMTTPDKDGNYDVGRAFFYKKQTNADGKEFDAPDLEMVKEHFLTPKPVIFAGPKLKRQVIHVDTGGNHLLVVARNPGTDFAQLYSSGNNNYGQLGLGDQKNRHELTHVVALEHEYIAKVAAGEHFSLALSHDGKRLYAFGRSDYGSLGIGFEKDFGTGTSKTTPQPVPFPKGTVITNIECGERHSFAITTKFEVYGWGFGETGAVGMKQNFDRDIFYPTKLDLTNYVDGDVVQVHAVAGGGQHSLMLVKRYRKA